MRQNPAMHRNHPHRNTNGCKQPPSHSKANSTQHTHFNIPEHCKDSALGAKHSARRIQHPGQTTHAKPSRTSRYSPEPHHPHEAAPPKPTETSCASRNAPEPDSQSIKNTDPARPRDHPERTNEPRTPRHAPPNGSDTPCAIRTLTLSVTTRPQPAAMEADGIEPTTSCLQSRRSPN